MSRLVYVATFLDAFHDVMAQGRSGMATNPLTTEVEDAVSRLCLHFPEAEEFISHGSPNYKVRGKSFATYSCNHHGDGCIALLANRSVPDQAILVENEPAFFYVPQYVGHRGWVAIHLNQGLAWKRIFMEVEAAYMRVAPKSLVAAIAPLLDFKEPRKVPTAAQLNPFTAGRPKEILDQVREICLALPEATEGLQFGNPVFKAGKKGFCNLYAGGELNMSFWVGADMQAALTFDDRFYIPAYTGHNGWISLRIKGKSVNWQEISELAESSYRHFALKRMLKAMDTID